VKIHCLKRGATERRKSTFCAERQMARMNKSF